MLADVAVALNTQATTRLLPAEIAYGRKRGFSIPAAAWLRGPMVPFMRDVLSPENLLKARAMAEAWDGQAAACDVPLRATA